MKIKKKGIVFVTMLALASIFSAYSFFVEKQSEEKPVVEKVEAAQTTSSGTRVHVVDEWGASQWTKNGVDACMDIYDVKYVTGSGYTDGSFDGIEENHIFCTSMYNGGSYLHVRMKFYSQADNTRQYEAIFPWYIKEFKYKFYATDNNTDRYVYNSNGGAVYVFTLQQYKNIRVNFYSTSWNQEKTNYYGSNRYNTSDNYTYTLNGIKSGSQVYLDLSQFTDWELSSAKFAMFFMCSNVSKNGEWGKIYNTERTSQSDSFMWKINGSDNDHFYECIAPQYNGSDVYWTTLIAVRCPSSKSSPTFDDKYNETNHMVYAFDGTGTDLNVVKVTGWGAGGISWQLSTNDRTLCYGEYFNSTIVCNNSGSFSGSWNTVKNEYMQRISTEIQGSIYTASENPSGTSIEKAMSKYDYIVHKYGTSTYSDFIGRGTGEKSPGWTYGAIGSFSPFEIVLGEAENSLQTIIIIIASSISLLSITALSVLVIKKKKIKEE